MAVLNNIYILALWFVLVWFYRGAIIAFRSHTLSIWVVTLAAFIRNDYDETTKILLHINIHWQLCDGNTWEKPKERKRLSFTHPEARYPSFIIDELVLVGRPMSINEGPHTGCWRSITSYRVHGVFEFVNTNPINLQCTFCLYRTDNTIKSPGRRNY